MADEELERLDAVVARVAFASRAEAVRAGLARVLREEREAQIERAYRRAYAVEPGDDKVGEVGLALGAQLLSDHDAVR